VISHGPKFREPQHINWKHNFKIIMDAVEDYARRWIKREVDQDPKLRVLVKHVQMGCTEKESGSSHKSEGS
jgi:hypothetical protein